MKPLAQDFTVIARSPERLTFVMEPGLIKLPSGRLLATFPYLDPRQKNRQLPDWFNLYVSDDGGASWRRQGSLDLVIGMPFVVEGHLYMLGNRRGRRDIVITRSDDEGETWTPLTTLFRGQYWNCPTGFVIKNGFLYRATGGSQGSGRETLVIACDLSKDLLDPAAWRISNRLLYPGTPPELAREGKVRGGHWLEPNVVEVKGRLYVLSTVKITSESGWTTPGTVAVCSLEDDGVTLDYRFLQYYPTPGGQLKFHIIYDEVSGLFWRTMNLPADTSSPPDPRWAAREEIRPVVVTEEGERRIQANKGGDRRILALSCSLDALNWLQAGVIAMTPRPWEGFQYAVPLVDGDDLLVISRTSLDGVNQHDANLITLHRVMDFRSLALDIHPRFE
ncbi:MAG: exo-alpha-sialidase [Armatimonadetes bacterium]|nr:exo-alpha-sialidase [Armatimonadota bacterium]